MTLVRVTPALGALPELLTYQCPRCWEVVTEEQTVRASRGRDDAVQCRILT